MKWVRKTEGTFPTARGALFTPEERKTRTNFHPDSLQEKIGAPLQEGKSQGQINPTKYLEEIIPVIPEVIPVPHHPPQGSEAFWPEEKRAG